SSTVFETNRIMLGRNDFCNANVCDCLRLSVGLKFFGTRRSQVQILLPRPLVQREGNNPGGKLPGFFYSWFLDTNEQTRRNRQQTSRRARSCPRPPGGVHGPGRALPASRARLAARAWPRSSRRTECLNWRPG